MKTLVYTTCYGAPVYAEMARVLIESLRTRAGYTQDVVVLTDGTPGLGDVDARLVTTPRTDSPFERRGAKLFAADALDPAGYDRILYLDTDIVAIGDLTPLFDLGGAGLAAGDEEPFNRVTAPSMNACLTLRERVRFRHVWGLNSGAVCFDAARFRELVGLWKHQLLLCKPRLRTFIDQPALNAVALRGVIEVHRYPRGLIELPPLYKHFGRDLPYAPTAATRLLHFCGHEDKLKTPRRMRRALVEGR